MNYTEKIPEEYLQTIKELTKIAVENNFTVYAVGGFVRDIILGRQPNDLDIMAEGDNGGIRFAQLVAEKLNLHPPVVFERFATAKLELFGHEIEFIMPRKEYYDKNSRNPDTEIGTLEQDVLRRDFTVNTLFLRLNDMQILDILGKGFDDIKNKIIRVTDETAADIIFEQDPLRILRAVRQSFQLGFEIENNTYKSMKNKVSRISIVSGERIRDEFEKILLLQKPSQALKMLDDIGILEIILPELKKTQNVTQPVQYHDKDVFGHTLDVVDRIPKDIILRTAALLHDIGKPETRTETEGKISFLGHEFAGIKTAKNIMTRLKYSADFINKVLFLIENHMYPKQYNEKWSDSAVRRFVKKTDIYLEDIKQLNMADSANYTDSLFARIENLKQKNMLCSKQELINGNELMKIFSVPAGKWIAEAKKYIEELQYEQPDISKEEAIKKLKEYIENSTNIVL